MSLSDTLLQLALSGIALGTVYGIVGLGFTIIYNATGVINFAQGEFVMLGGLIAVTLAQFHVPPLASALIAGIVVALVGILLERLAIRPVSRRSVMAMITVTIGASMALRGLALALWGPNAQALDTFSGDTPIAVGGAALAPQELWVVGTALLIVVATQLFFNLTVVGKAMRACAINRVAAQLAGIGVERMTLLAFGLSAGMSGVAGVVLAPLTMVSCSSGTPLAVKGFCAAIVGGLGNGVGAVAGGVLLGVLESMGAGLVSSGYKNAFAFLVLLLVLFLRPSGLFARKSAEGL
jgi:branched-chain amino acid transport system permease protein